MVLDILACSLPLAGSADPYPIGWLQVRWPGQECPLTSAADLSPVVRPASSVPGPRSRPGRKPGRALADYVAPTRDTTSPTATAPGSITMP